MDSLMSGLTIVLIFLVLMIIILAFVYWNMSRKAKRKAEEEENTSSSVGATTKVATEYTKKSIFKFMQFDKIEDNMIIQDNGQRYLMVIECEGVKQQLKLDLFSF